jgi:hypothetical protein
VEALDRAFESVCELDLVFHFDEVRHIQLGSWRAIIFLSTKSTGSSHLVAGGTGRTGSGDECGRDLERWLASTSSLP